MGEYGVAFQNEPVDVSREFTRQENHFFVGSKVSDFDPRSASGRILWKGRESYSSEEETREVASRMRKQRIPCDVIHLDTDWTEVPHFHWAKPLFEAMGKTITHVGPVGAGQATLLE